MKYLEWNNCIADYFFTPEKSGDDICLYITKKDVILIGKGKTELRVNDEEIWSDFIAAIKSGMPGSSNLPTLIDKATYTYEFWKKPRPKFIDGIAVTSPFYIGYLIFFIIPLTEEIFELHARNYYGRLSAFLKANLINQRINSLQDLEPLWNDLEEWSILTMNGDLGFFSLGKYSANYKYVGKPFSQCIFSPASIKRLPELFFESGMIPNSSYSDTEMQQCLLRYGPSKLGLTHAVLELIKKSGSNELGQSIIQLVKREYSKWTGESHEFIENGAIEKRKRSYTISPLLLQFKLFSNRGQIQFSFRMHSFNDYPEDLKFGDIEVLNIGKGFSKVFDLPTKSSLDPFDLKDDFNKWIARFPKKDVRLFISAGIYQLSADYWIETETLSKTDRMYLLCRNEVKEKIENWGDHFKQGTFSLIDNLEGLPEDYSLFSFLNPSISFEGIPVLTILSGKTIQLLRALRITHRSFTNDFLPDVEISNSDGNEIVYMQYRNHNEKIFLEKKQTSNNRWGLPEEIVSNVDFHIKVENEHFSGNDIAYSIICTDHSARKVDGINLPKRDAFGRKSSKELQQYSIGSNTIGINLRRQESYRQFFINIFEDTNEDLTVPKYINQEGNILLSFLTYRNTSSTEEFYEAFEFLHSKNLDDRIQESNINYSKIKRGALNMYDYLGYLDYDYESKEIVVNPPQLIFIPAAKGRRVLLIGGRDSAFVNTMLEIAPKHHLQVEITKQSSLNRHLLLPDAITVKAYGGRSENFGERNIKAFAEELGINFNPNDLIQVGMQLFAADIDEYERDLIDNNETNEDDYDWARKIFNPASLTYERSSGETFDKSFSLVEYKLNEYTYYNKLWKDQKCYLIDKNWGKYLALKHFNKQVILYDVKKHKVAIPFELPLPRLLAESIMLLSGIAPVYLKIDSKAYRIYDNIPSPFIKNLFDKLKQTTIEFNL
ncbi:hypothetical protein [Daejeonella sp.]|uniref:hypothetical protein n=1 Tax=Daejeonella sp. TaxID=2805397 RepID=UPI0027309EB2|nr:hypothetical protein [Daejeonella sp.]MDP2413377.1 hypothetical protein [Daejeonella sp.]